MSNGGHNRSPLLRGLLLILLGGIFLLYRFDRDLGIGHLFARYWPVLIILWGVSRLAEHSCRARKRRCAPAFLSGGEAALLVAVIVVLCGMAAVDILLSKVAESRYQYGLTEPYTQTQNLRRKRCRPARIWYSDNREGITVHAGRETS